VQVAREQGTDIIKINPKKIRNGSCNWDYNLMWSDEEKGLVEAMGRRGSIQAIIYRGLPVSVL